MGGWASLAYFCGGLCGAPFCFGHSRGVGSLVVVGVLTTTGTLSARLWYIDSIKSFYLDTLVYHEVLMGGDLLQRDGFLTTGGTLWEIGFLEKGDLFDLEGSLRQGGVLSFFGGLISNGTLNACGGLVNFDALVPVGWLRTRGAIKDIGELPPFGAAYLLWVRLLIFGTQQFIGVLFSVGSLRGNGELSFLGHLMYTGDFRIVVRWGSRVFCRATAHWESLVFSWERAH